MSGPINPNVSADTPTIYSGTYVSGSVSVGTAATLIVTVPGGFNGGVTLNNAGTASVFVGGSAVTTATGLPIASGATTAVPGGKGTQRGIYGVAAAALTVKYLLAQ